MGLRFLTSYVANILRMVLIVLFGVYGDSQEESVQNLLVAHSNLGWIIFLAWIALFWAVVLRVMGVKNVVATETALPRKRGVLCDLCGDTLTPALPGYRCSCGKFYRAVCAAGAEECPKCHRPVDVPKAPKSPTMPRTPPPSCR